MSETPTSPETTVAAVCDPPVAAVYDRPVAAVYDRRKDDSNCSGGLRPPGEDGSHRQPLQGELGSHRQPLQGELGSHRQPLQKKRLARLERVFVDSPIFFVTACTEGRKPLLANAQVHKALRKFCLESLRYGVWPGRYVLMPDHLHLFVMPGESTLSAWMKSLKNSLSKTLRGLGHDAPHWQKGFFDHVLRSGESYSQKWDYVRENPVRAGLVSAAEEWIYAGEIHNLEFRK